MRLPLRVWYDYYGLLQVLDSGHRIICSFRDSTEDREFVQALVRKMNGNWRWKLLGQQPYEKA